MSIQQKFLFLHTKRNKIQQLCEENQFSPFLKEQFCKYSEYLQKGVQQQDKIPIYKLFKANQFQFYKYILLLRLRNSHLQIQEQKNIYEDAIRQQQELTEEFKQIQIQDASVNEDLTKSYLIEPKYKLKNQKQYKIKILKSGMSLESQFDILSTQHAETIIATHQDSADVSKSPSLEKIKHKMIQESVKQRKEQTNQIINQQISKQPNFYKEKFQQNVQGQEVKKSFSLEELDKDNLSCYNEKDQRLEINQQEDMISQFQDQKKEDKITLGDIGTFRQNFKRNETSFSDIQQSKSSREKSPQKSQSLQIVSKFQV